MSLRNDRKVSLIVPQQYGYLNKNRTRIATIDMIMLKGQFHGAQLIDKGLQTIKGYLELEK